MQTIEATAISTTPRDRVWALLAEASTWLTWGTSAPARASDLPEVVVGHVIQLQRIGIGPIEHG